MLINKPFEKNEIITMKLVTGEEVIASVEQATDSSIHVYRPMAIGHNEQGMGLMPWTYSAETIEIHRASIVGSARTEPDVAKAYTSSTTNIQLAQ